jgi:hypothetical protein
MPGATRFEAAHREDEGLVDLTDLSKSPAAGLWALGVDMAGFLSQIPDARVGDLDA